MDGELARLSRRHPLPPGWSAPQLFGDEVRLGAVTVRRVGIACRSAEGVEATGSAADMTVDMTASPLPRAWFELLERTSLLSAGPTCVVRDAEGRDLGEVAVGCPEPGDDPRRRRARSNGVALHESWARACEAARLELVERDRVLRAWCGELDLEAVDPPPSLRAIDSHEWRAARIVDGADVVDGADDEVAVVVGFPRRADTPLTRGFAARRSLADAVQAAANEAVQSLAFVCDEPVPTEEPRLAPSPMFHLDYYLWPAAHDALRRWLDDGHRSLVRARPVGRDAYRGAATSSPRRPLRFVDLTPHGGGSTLRVARALGPDALPLFFGELPEELARRLPSSLRVHPIA